MLQKRDTARHADVIIIGAGLSGIGVACHLRMHCPDKSFIILESRDTIGGTWDLFRYPGVRSDSDMFTLGYQFRPWRQAKAIADGAAILDYVRETARAYDVERAIQFGQRCVRADWSSGDAAWTVETVHGADQASQTFSCNMLVGCSGYYDYENGYMPDYAGIGRFAGRIIHPQFWPQDFDYAGKRVIVIGSGATAVTLVPALAQTAAQVTMVQRSPSYVVTLPSVDRLADTLRDRLPARLAHRLIRARNVLISLFLYTRARKKPEQTRAWIKSMIRKQLGPDYDVDTHFTPRYNPWDQRLCLVPDGDLFRAIRKHHVEIVTDKIEHFTERGLQLGSGREIEADVVVSATGLVMRFIGGMALSVDGVAVDIARTTAYKGMMYSDVPNLVTVFGYTNASWTLKADLTSAYLCRLLNFMGRNGYEWCTPRRRDPALIDAPLLDFTSGYVQRAIDRFPRQGSKKPWRLYQNYVLDLLTLRLGRVNDREMEFSRRGRRGVLR